MYKEIIKAIIAILVILAAVFYPSEWTLGAVALVVGYYFGRGKDTLKAAKKK